MLNPNNDRLDYGQILAPSPGFQLDFAVGTTYSLDLDALVGASLAMGLSEETDSALMNNPVCLLEALRSVGDKVALFCEDGQIHLPGKVTPLYILLEKMVFSVKTQKRKKMAAYPSFHPKFWLIRYQSKQREIQYRIVVLSRNLTFDRSWDVTYYMDGHLKKEQIDKNEPVCDFLHSLLPYISGTENGKEKSRRLRSVIKELPYVRFEPGEKEFYDYCFIPNGVKRADGSYYRFDETPLFKETFHEMLIISPFVSGDIIRLFNSRNERSPIENSRYMLITRSMSLAKLKPEDVTHFRLFTLKDSIIDGETAISEENTAIQKQDIHAKIYMMRKYSDSALYLGSLNASHNAVYGNVEFMLCLYAKNRYLNMDRLSASLFGDHPDGPDNPFQETSLEEASIIVDDPETDLNAVIKSISRSHPTAAVSVQDEDHYSIHLCFGYCDTKDMQVFVRPLLSQKEEQFSQNIVFGGLSLTQLSSFFVITVTDGEHAASRVLIIPTTGLPESRENAVVSSIVSDQDCFYRYVAFLLGDDSILSALEISEIDHPLGNGVTKSTSQIPALYEKMLLTAATAPEKFKGIEYLMKTIAEDGIIPDEFRTLYDKFKKVVKLNG